jgi:hypothetical protein
MSALTEKELVHAPLASANGFVQAFFAAHALRDGEGARIVLHAGDAAHPAIVSLHPAHRPEDMTPRYRVHWEAESGGNYPVYDGELMIGADNDYDAFWLILDGAYVPPGGVAGQLFDALVGHRIAVAAARGLLTEMRADIESRFAAQELAKTAR